MMFRTVYYRRSTFYLRICGTINGYLDKKEAAEKDEKTYDRSKEVYTTKIKK
jgi:hypothetical protein